MRRDKIIAVVGVSEEETAHLRLLLRKCAADLDHVWRWGDESHADLVVVDLASFAGQMTQTRAQAAGVRCAVFSVETALDGANLILRRPLLSSNVVAVLNEAARAAPAGAQIAPQTEDFYTRDLDDASPDAAAAAVRAHADEASQSPFEAPAGGLDELLRPEPIELRSALPRGPKFGAATIAPAPTTPSDVRAGAAAESPPRVVPPAPARNYATRAAMLTDTAPRSLRSYLDEDLLGGPARIAAADAPPLVLDPKLRVLHSPGSLAALQPYCRASWRLCDWQALTSAELNDLRASQPAQPYSRLIWLDTLVHSRGHLARHLDPGGTYRLKHWIEIERELSRYFRIASSMLQPARLHEIAAASGAPMADVFDVVNAYEAIGLIEWQPRPRRDDGATAPNLLQRLRNPFGKT